MSTQLRQPKGQTVGGQFAPDVNPEATVDLGTEPNAQQERKDALLEQLADGVDQLTTSEEWERYLDFQTRFHRYSFNNTMLIMLQKPEATRVASFKAWKGMDRTVKKGEKALYVLAPMMGKRKPKDGEDPDAVKDLKTIYGFKGVPVFDVSQTEGEPLPEPVTKLDGDDAEGHFAQLAEVAQSLGFWVVDHEFTDGVNGDCNHADKVIRVHAANSPAQRVKTLTHELAHAMLHEDTAWYRENRGQAELEAESTAYVVCQTLGIETSGYSFGYVASWGGGGDEVRKRIKGSGDRIQKTAVAILTGLDSLP
jgi:N-terminal domain of anti-restriction factor ArdC/IrrE N-terminal-like domain